MQQQEEVKDEIVQSAEITSIFTNKIDYPPLSNEDKRINWEIVSNAVPNKIDGKDKDEFKSMWRIIKNMAKTYSWSEKNLTDVLAFALSGEAQDIFLEQDEGTPFQQRLKNLLVVFLPSDNYASRKLQLEQFKRKKGEVIEATMARLDFYITRTNSGYPKHARRGRRECLLEDVLLKVCSPMSKERIEAKASEAFNSGYFLSIEEKVEIAAKCEQVMGHIPVDDISISIDEGRSGRPNAFVFNIQREEQLEADTNSVSGTFRDSARSSHPRSPSRHNHSREDRRRDLSEKRSLSREDMQRRNRKVSFDDHPESNLNTFSTTETQKEILDIGNGPSFAPRKSNPLGHVKQAGTNHFDAIEAFMSQKKLIEKLQNRVEELFRINAQSQVNGRTSRIPETFDRTFEIDNMWPERFNIRINPKNRRYGNQMVDGHFLRFPTKNNPTYEYGPRESRDFVAQAHPPSYSRRTTSYSPRFSPERPNQNWNQRQAFLLRGHNQLYGNQHFPATNQAIDKNNQRARLINCHYCGSNERHNWSKCGEEFRNRRMNLNGQVTDQPNLDMEQEKTKNA